MRDDGGETVPPRHVNLLRVQPVFKVWTLWRGRAKSSGRRSRSIGTGSSGSGDDAVTEVGRLFGGRGARPQPRCRHSTCSSKFALARVRPGDAAGPAEQPGEDLQSPDAAQ